MYAEDGPLSVLVDVKVATQVQFTGDENPFQLSFHSVKTISLKFLHFRFQNMLLLKCTLKPRVYFHCQYQPQIKIKHGIENYGEKLHKNLLKKFCSVSSPFVFSPVLELGKRKHPYI